MDNETFTDPQEKAPAKTPRAEEILKRLYDVDLSDLDLELVGDQLKGNRIWIPILTVPVSAVILALFTLLGTFLFDQPLISFVITAALLLWIGNMLENSQNVYTYKAREEVRQRIADIEEGFGLLPHFQSFLPKRYRHLWQSVRKGNYIYIEQYVQAIDLLQNKLEPEKFTKIWHIKFPETDPENEDYEEETEAETTENLTL